jgi:histidine triad (HIT) family protein
VETTRGGERRADCIFCRIVAGQAPVSTVFDGEGVVAFMDVNPVRPGHVLVVPKAHRAQLWEMRDEEFASVYRHLPTLVRALKRAMEADAVDVLNLNGSAGGQTVFHVHYHLIPIHRADSPVRRDGRSVGFAFEQQAAAREELDRLAEKIGQAVLDPASREPEIGRP